MNMMIRFNGEFTAGLTEAVPLEQIAYLFRFSHHYEEFLRRAEEDNTKEAYVHCVLSKKGESSGKVRVIGVSLNPEDIEHGRQFDGIGSGAVKYVEQRRDEIRELLNYQEVLYTVIYSPTSDKIIADSRRQF